MFPPRSRLALRIAREPSCVPMPPTFAAIQPPSPLPAWAWAAFFAFIVAVLALDLGLFRRSSREIPMREAVLWCGIWVGLALGFAALIFLWRGTEPAQQFLAGYLVEVSLSVDNIFVFA
ncbi:MAG: hypothetical protein KGJ37_06890, partial [Verrucomicrobiota bacterium]|nr:hypothetical protein [Verrucomicrobiota bacterium]